MSKSLITFVITCILLVTGCKESPTPSPTPKPTNTAIPTVPTATPQVVKSLPNGCVGWLSGLRSIVYLCEDATTISVTDGQCMVVHSDYVLRIHFQNREAGSKPGAVIKNPEDNICTSGTMVADIWAEEVK